MESVEILSTVPIFPSRMITRKRLINILDKVVSCRVAVVSAPSGYGKTALVSQFVQQSNLPVIWHSAQPYERDLSYLFDHFKTLLKSVIPQSLELRYHLNASPEELALQLTYVMNGRPESHAIYVIDNSDHLFTSTASQRWLQSFVSTLPINWHLILICQTQPPIDFAELVANRAVLSIGRTGLRFEKEEIYQLAEVAGVTLTEDQLQYIEGYLSGWPAGTAIALQSTSGLVYGDIDDGAVNAEQLFSAIADQLLSGLSPLLRRFMLTTSTFEKITAQLCSQVLNIHDCQRYFVELLERNLFAVQEQGGIVYHALFRTFLQNYILMHEPNLFYALHARAGDWFERNHSVDEAVEHYSIAGEIERAISIVEQHALPYKSQGKFETLVKWSELFQNSAYRTPKLQFACAMIRTTRYDYEHARKHLENARKGFEANNDTLGEIQTEIEQANILNQLGHYQQASNEFERILGLQLLPAHLMGGALLGRGWSRVQAGNLKEAVKDFETALECYQRVGDDMATCQALHNLEIAFLRLGLLENALNCAQEALSIERQLENEQGLAQSLNNLGYEYHMFGAYEDAQRTLEEGLRVAARVNQRRLEAYLLSSMADLLRDCGAFEDAQLTYERALGVLRTSEPSLQCALLLGLATTARWQQQYTDSAILAGDAFAIAKEHKFDYLIAKARLLKYAAEIHMDSVETDKVVSECIEQHKHSGAVIELIRACAIGASAALLRSDKLKAIEYIDLALKSAKHPAHLNVLAVESTHTPLFREFIENNPRKYVAIIELQEKLRRAPISSVKSLPIDNSIAIPCSLHVLCLGDTLVERDNVVISQSAWRGQLAQHIFLYLLMNGKTKRDTLALIFWPDDTTEQVRDKFHTHMLRARRALGDGVIVFDDDMYLLNPEMKVFCDALMFEKVIKQARHLSVQQQLTEDLWRQAVNLYKGDFLPSFEGDWIFQRRLQYQKSYMEALLGLGKCFQVRSKWNDASTIYRRGRQDDPLREDFCYELMICLAKLGRMKEVKQEYDDFTSMLKRELNSTPSQTLADLFRSLLK